MSIPSKCSPAKFCSQTGLTFAFAWWVGKEAKWKGATWREHYHMFLEQYTDLRDAFH